LPPEDGVVLDGDGSVEEEPVDDGGGGEPVVEVGGEDLLDEGAPVLVGGMARVPLAGGIGNGGIAAIVGETVAPGVRVSV
jgi:hypothetical protein